MRVAIGYPESWHAMRADIIPVRGGAMSRSVARWGELHL